MTPATLMLAVLMMIPFGAFAAPLVFVNDAGYPARVDYLRLHEADTPIIGPQRPVPLKPGAFHRVEGLGRGIYHYMVCGGGWCSQLPLAVHQEKQEYVIHIIIDGDWISSRVTPDHWEDYFRNRSSRHSSAGLSPVAREKPLVFPDGPRDLPTLRSLQGAAFQGFPVP